ncbi:hypothetical protein [Nocardia sp. NPDC006630]|uniref:hypothetical protein n=1 Tax=Nocardia sp. NPDC006630 TaxID=3157181 RepID=UPI0033AF6385
MRHSSAVSLLILASVSLVGCSSTSQSHPKSDVEQIQDLWSRGRHAVADGDIPTANSLRCAAEGPMPDSTDLSKDTVFKQDLQQIKIDGDYAVGGLPYSSNGLPQDSGPYAGQRLDWVSFHKEGGSWKACDDTGNPLLGH